MDGIDTSDCGRCHAADDPHEDQFPDRTCAACHDTGTFAIPEFDHERTRFPLV